MGWSKLAMMFVVPAAAAVAAAAVAAPAAHGSEAEAENMVKTAVALVRSAGPESAYKTFTEHTDGAFKDRDLYVWVYDFQGNCLAHGANAKMVGKNLMAMKDADGNDLLKGELAVVKTKGGGWYGPFKFVNRATLQIEERKAYCLRSVGDTMVCAGVTASK